MRCLICRQTEIVGRLTSVKFQHGEMSLMVSGVPAWTCPSCGEAYLDEDVATRLLQNVEEMSKAGMRQEEIEYEGV